MKLLLTIGAIALTGYAANPKPAAEDTVDEPEVVQTETQKDPWTDFVEKYLTADKVAMYMSWVAYIGTIVGLVANINKLKKANNLTLRNVSDEVQKKLEDVVGKQVADEVGKFIPAVIKTQEKTNDILRIFSNILALSQENTPESRIAILKLIEELGTIGRDITGAAQEVIEAEKKAIEEKKEEVGAKLDEIIDSYDGTSI